MEPELHSWEAQKQHAVSPPNQAADTAPHEEFVLPAQRPGSRSPRGSHSPPTLGSDSQWVQSDWRDPGWQESWPPDVGEPWYIDEHDMVLSPMDDRDHQYTLVVLHSCSGGPDDVTAFFHRLSVPFRRQIRVVVPCAPLRRENHYGWENTMNSWFEYEGNGVRHLSQLLEQRSRIKELLDLERKRLPGQDARRMVLMGLSQGVGLAIDVALRWSFPLGGVVALRGMALPPDVDGALPQMATSPWLEVLAFNGERDWLCPPAVAKASYEALQAHGVRVHFDTDPWLAHGCARGRQKLCQKELQSVSDFLCRIWGHF